MRSLARALTVLALLVAAPAVGAVQAAPSPSQTLAPASAATRAPGAPTGVKATPGDGSVKVGWKAPASTGGKAITAYRVQQRNGSTWRQVATTNGSGRSARITGLANGSAVTFRVVAVNRDGAGTPSSTVTATPRTTPSAPRSVAADDRHEGARVTWTPPASNGGSAITGYVIQAAAGNGSFRTVGAAPANATSKTVGGLDNGKTYRLRVAAVNAAGPGAYSSPSPSILLPSVLSIDADDTHTCAVTPGHTVVCWGRNLYGNLGDGTNDDSDVPVEVVGLTDVNGVSVGDDFTCAVKSDGTVWCWGVFSSGVLGASYDTPQYDPVQVPGITNAVSVDAHSFQGACALLSTGEVTCWGVNSDGQFGLGSEPDIINSVAPGAADGMSDATHLAAGSGHTCVLREGGTVLCWGSRIFGQTGTGVSQNEYLSPATALAPLGFDGVTFVGLTAGGDHTCLMDDEGIFYCTGNDSNGQLGDGTSGSSSGNFTAIADLTGTDIDAGLGTTCAVTTDGGVSCWGSGYAATPAPVSGISNASQVAVGLSHRCVVLTDGTPRCWGANNFGQLGNGSTTDSSTPVRPTGL